MKQRTTGHGGTGNPSPTGHGGTGNPSPTGYGGTGNPSPTDEEGADRTPASRRRPPQAIPDRRCRRGVICLFSPVTSPLSLLPCHLSLVTSPSSPVTCHFSLVTCHLSLLPSPLPEQKTGALRIVPGGPASAAST